MTERKKQPIYNLLTLHAEYDKDLHDAIIKGDSSFIEEHLNSCDSTDKSHYNFEDPVDINKLRALTIETDHEFELAFKTGNKIMGM